MNLLEKEIDSKMYVRILIGGLICILLYVLLSSGMYLVPRIYHISDETIIDDDGIIKNGISKLNIGNKLIELEGWAYKEGQDIKSYNCYFILKSQTGDKMYKIKTVKKNVDALAIVDNTYNCLNSGMYTKSLITGIKKGIYDIYILYQNDNENILTNTNLSMEIH